MEKTKQGEHMGSRPQGASRREDKGPQEELQGVRCHPCPRGAGIPSPWGRTEGCRPCGCTGKKMGEEWMGLNVFMKTCPGRAEEGFKLSSTETKQMKG